MNELSKKLIAEFIGSFMAGCFGLMAVAVAVAAGGMNLFEVVLMFGLVIALIVYATVSISGCHINPAVTLTMAVFKGFPWRHVIPYILTQIAGWGVGALVLYFIYSGIITSHEAANGIVRGTLESQKTAMIFNAYAPHPLFAAANGWGAAVMPTWKAIISEMLATFVLIFTILVCVEEKNPFKPSRALFALIIGLTVAFVMGVASPATMSAINPARDLGPRIATWLLGWGSVSFPGPPSGMGGPWYIFTVGPILGGMLAGIVHKFIEPFYPKA